MPESDVPMFEGKPVEASTVKLTTGTNGLPIDAVVRMDDIVHLVVEARVRQVNHQVNEKTGALVRHQSLIVISASVTPWDHEDPNDDGVLRG